MRYDVDRTPYVTIGGDGTAADPILGSVFSATKTATGFIVAESQASALLYLDAQGKLIRSAGRQGQGPGEFIGGIFVGQCAGDSVLAWDSRTNRILVFTPAGQYARQIPAPGSRFACSRSGHIALVLRPSAVARTDGPADRISSVRLMNARGDSVGVVTGIPLGGTQMFGPATSVAVRGEELYVGTGQAPAIDVYDRRGRPLRRITFSHVPVRTSPAAQERAVEDLLNAMQLDGQQRAQQRAAFMSRPIPAEYPPYREFAVAPNGTVWLLTTQPSDTVARLRAVRDDGAIVAEANLPAPAARLLEAGDDYILLAYLDADGDLRVGAFHVRRPQG